MTRTAVLTFVAVIWTTVAFQSDWSPFNGLPVPLLVQQVLGLLALCALPVLNIFFAVRDARGLAAKGDYNADLGRWLVTVLAVLINLVLLGLPVLLLLMINAMDGHH